MSARKIQNAVAKLRDAVDEISFAPPVAYVYNPLRYAWEPHRRYLSRFSGRGAKTLMLGMNPGPWGMAQTGVPFGEVALVRDWMGIKGRVDHPEPEHEKRVIEGFECARSEVSGRRLWGWAKERFASPEDFFDRFFVWNYCPLAFLEESGRNRTPDKLPASEREALFDICDVSLRRMIELLEPERALGVGTFAEKCLRRVVGDLVEVGSILHPSPASPKANRGWAAQAEAELREQGLADWD